MKRILKILLVLSLCINANNIYAQRSFFDAVPNPYHPANQNAIQDGWYEAIIQYSSHTGQESTYKLNVKVENLSILEETYDSEESIVENYIAATLLDLDDYEKRNKFKNNSFNYYDNYDGFFISVIK